MAYEHTNSKGTQYYLNSKVVQLRGGNRQQTIYYFSKKPTASAIEDIPSGFSVVESKRTGLPVLKRG